MGGGDLNLKKSWHPTTLKNMERVWKAEQKHEAEKKKIEELQKELSEERAREEIRNYAEQQGVVKKKSQRLDWMYEGPSAMLNREDYLLGKSVDKTFELLQQTENGSCFKVEDNPVPESILKSSVGNVTIDLENKIREDPLLLIRKQEEENRRKLLENPIKMKQLQQMLLEMNAVKSGKTKDKRKKDKKKRRRKDSSDSDDDDERKRSRHRESSIKRKHRKAENVRRRSSNRSDSDDSDSEPFRKRAPSPRSRRPNRQPSFRRRSRSYERNRIERRDRKRSRTPERQKDQRHESSYRKRSPSGRKELSFKKLNAVEKEKKLKEMLDNAKWREEQRSNNVKRHKAEEAQEIIMAEKNAGTDFITPMLNKVADVGSVASRIKSNIYNIQRTKSALDSNFAKR